MFNLYTSENNSARPTKDLTNTTRAIFRRRTDVTLGQDILQITHWE